MIPLYQDALMRIKLPFGTTAENNQLMLPEGMLTVDLERKAIRLHDGVTQGGFEMLGVQAFTPSPGDIWTEITGHGITGIITDLHYGERLVAIFAPSGTYNSVRFSSDLVNWTTDPLGQNSHHYNIEYYNGVYVIAPSSDSSLLRTSPNLDTWTGRAHGFDDAINKLKVANATLFIIGDGGNISTSTTGTAFTSRLSTGIDLYDIAFGNGIYVAVGGSNANAYSRTSTDGISWPNQNLVHANGRMTSVAFGNGVFVAVSNYLTGNIFTSTDGINWTMQDSSVFGVPINDIIFAADKFIAVGNTGKMAVSSDGVTWTARDVSTSMGVNDFTAITYGGGKFFASGNGGKIIVS